MFHVTRNKRYSIETQCFVFFGGGSTLGRGRGKCSPCRLTCYPQIQKLAGKMYRPIKWSSYFWFWRTDKINSAKKGLMGQYSPRIFGLERHGFLVAIMLCFTKAPLHQGRFYGGTGGAAPPMKNVAPHFGPASLDFHLNRPVISLIQLQNTPVNP